MTRERPVELDALPPQLHALFDGLLRNLGRNDQDEADFLSRALAAFTVLNLASIEPAQAAAAVVDGGQDGGIDAIHVDEPSATIWLVQAKFIQNGTDLPSLVETTRFIHGAEAIQAQRFGEMARNAEIAAKIPEIERVLRQPGTVVKAVLCFSSIRILPEDRTLAFGASRNRHQFMGEDHLVYDTVNLSRLAGWLQIQALDGGVDIDALELLSPGVVAEPHRMAFGLVPLDVLADLYRQHGERLLVANLRGYKGRTDVNDMIERAALEEASLFAHLNNGLTAYCDSLVPLASDVARLDGKRFRVHGLRVINGAQTIGSVKRAHDAARAEGRTLEGGQALIKIISLERFENDIEHAQKISRAANFQNAVTTRDFASIYPLHQAWRDSLNLVGIGYHFRLDDQTPDPGERDFTIEEALTAAACVANSNSCELLTRVAANRESLRSLEPIDVRKDPDDHWHGRVFPHLLSARTLWRAVQVQRLVTDVIRNQQRSSNGARREFWNHSRWLLLAAVFNRLQVQSHERELTLTLDEVATVSDAVISYGEKLLAIAVREGYARYEDMSGQQVLRTDRSFQSIFKTQEDCRRLFGALKAEIWRNPAAQAANEGDDDQKTEA